MNATISLAGGFIGCAIAAAVVFLGGETAVWVSLAVLTSFHVGYRCGSGKWLP